MLPRETVASAAIPGSDARLHLVTHGRDFIIMIDRDELMSAAQTWFGPDLEAPVILDRIVLFEEPESGMPFARLSEHRLGQ